MEYWEPTTNMKPNTPAFYQSFIEPKLNYLILNKITLSTYLKRSPS